VKEEYRLRAFESRTLKRIFGSERKEITEHKNNGRISTFQ
jgi:hypothetical protein